jgi:tetratricopeptide (TPR) repeat protein
MDAETDAGSAQAVLVMHKVSANVVVGCLTVCLLAGEAFPQQQTQFESLLASAQQAQAKGDFQSAAEFYKQSVVIHPEIPELRANLGLMYYQTGKNDQAAEAFLAALRLNPALFVPNLFLGLDYVKLKRFDHAIPYLKRAAISKPQDIQAQLALGDAYKGIGNTHLATTSYLRASEIDTRNSDIWYRLGISYLEQVEADARVLLTRYKDSAYLQLLMADNFAEQHAFIQSAEAYEKVLSLSNVPLGANANYGFVLLNRHDLVGAERVLSSELASNPGSLMSKLGMARLWIEQGKTDESAKEISQIWKTDAGFLIVNAQRLNAGLAQPKRVELRRALEEQQRSGDLSEEAVALFPATVTDERLPEPRATSNIETSTRATKDRTGPANQFYARGEYRRCSNQLAPRLQLLPPKDLRLLAFCAYSTGDYRHAFDAAKKMVPSATTEAEGLYWETKSAQRLAAEALAHASEMDSTSPKLHVLLGDLYRQRKYFAGAEQEYRKALSIQPEDTGALFGLALALLADEKIDEAFGVAQAALKNSFDDPELNAVMGEILCARHDFTGAEPYLKKSLNTKPEYVPHVHALLGDVYAHTDRIHEAIAELKLALPDDKDGHVHFQIGRLYLKIGDQDSAKEAFRISKQLIGQGVNRAAVAMQQGQDDSESP